MATDADYCTFCDVLLASCAVRRGVTAPTILTMPPAVEGTYTEAEYRGWCGCGCDGRIQPGNDICMAVVDGLETWCLVEHTRSEVSR